MSYSSFNCFIFDCSGENEIIGDPSASKHEAQSRQQMLDGLIQQAVDLEEFAKPSPVRMQTFEQCNYFSKQATSFALLGGWPFGRTSAESERVGDTQ